MLARFAATVAVAAAVVPAAACKKDAGSGDGRAGSASATGSAAAAACAGGETEGGALHWFHDDYAKALACAKAKGVPIAIDMWAPWCHTCLSMQAYVLTDAKFADFDRRFVFLALDTDRDVNAAPVARFPPAAWPTFFVVSSTDESIQSRFVGGASVEQFVAFLEDGERGHLANASAGKAPLTVWDGKARDGDQAASRKDWAAAAAAYDGALAVAPSEWVRRPDVLTSLISAHARNHDWAACAKVALDHMTQTGSVASASDFASIGLGCADELGPEAKNIAELVRDHVMNRLKALTSDPHATLSVDDRSDALMYLREALDKLDRKDEAHAAAMAQRTLLDEAAAKAPDPRVASTYNWPRSEVYLYLGVPLELVPALEKSVADLPAEYDPPYRLAWIYKAAGKLDEAKQWIDKALALVYGPRKTRALAMLADIEHARGDVAAERAARQAIVDTWNQLPPEARSAEAIDKAKADLAAVGSGSGSGATGSGKR